jgi:hypothetical protein
MDSPVNSAEDLAKQTKIKYGTYCCGSTNAFFQSSTIPTYQKLNAFMESAKPSVYTKGNSQGLDRYTGFEKNPLFFKLNVFLCICIKPENLSTDRQCCGSGQFLTRSGSGSGSGY